MNEQLPLLGYTIETTGPGQWTVRAQKPVLGRPTCRVARAAQIAQCSVHTIYVAILAGELEADNVTPKCKRVFTDSLYQFIKSRADEEHWTPARRAQWKAAYDRFHATLKPGKKLAKKPRKA